MRDPKVSNVPNESKLQRALMPNSRRFLLLLILFAVITVFFSDRLWLSICEGVIILLLIIYSVIMRARKRRTLERYIESVTYDTESARNNTLQNFPLPMAVFRPADSQVIWANQNFFDLCGRHKPTVDMRITDVIPEFSGRWLLEGNTQCPELLEYQGHKYQIHGNLVRTNPDDAASYMGITYWGDVTDYEKIRLEYYASRPIIAVIVIFVGAGMSMDNAWALADITMAFMCLTNIPSIMAMNKTAIAVMKDYGRQLAEGKKPVFKAKNIGLDDSNLDFWK